MSKNKVSPFNEYYKAYLDKDTLTDHEFRELVTNYLLGMNYYIVDPVNGVQANRIILDDIIHKFPQSKRIQKNDTIWLNDYKERLLQREKETEVKGK